MQIGTKDKNKRNKFIFMMEIKETLTSILCLISFMYYIRQCYVNIWAKEIFNFFFCYVFIVLHLNFNCI